MPRRALRLAPLLLAAAVTGYALGGCAGGSGDLPGLSGLTELPTGTLPDLTLPGPPTLPTPTEPEPDTTEESPPTIPEPDTTTVVETAVDTVPTGTEPAPTTPTETTEGENEGFLGWFALVLAAFRGETTTGETTTTTTTAVDTVPAGTVAPEPEPSESDTPWGWIALAVILGAAAVVLGVLLWRRRRAGRGS